MAEYNRIRHPKYRDKGPIEVKCYNESGNKS